MAGCACGGGLADVGGGPDDDAACPPEAEAASAERITRPRAPRGIFWASSQMSKKIASATEEMWGMFGALHHKAIKPP